MKLFLFRHGSTAGNVVKKYIGATDEELCEAGREEVRAERQALFCKDSAASECYKAIVSERRKIFCSPMKRAIETAKILFDSNPIQIESGLNEMNFGVFEKKNCDEMNCDRVLQPLYQAWLDSNCTAKCPDGESKAEFCERICASFLSLVEKENFATDAVIPIVCHGGTINALLERFAVEKKDYFAWRTAHGAYRFEEIEL